MSSMRYARRGKRVQMCVCKRTAQAAMVEGNRHTLSAGTPLLSRRHDSVTFSQYTAAEDLPMPSPRLMPPSRYASERQPAASFFLL